MTIHFSLHARSFKIGLAALFVCLGLTSFGCDGSENDTDVCEGLTDQFVGEGISRDECEASDRGVFVDGGCYCGTVS